MSRSWYCVGFNPAAKAILDEKYIIGQRKTIETYVDGRINEVVEDITTPVYKEKVYHIWEPDHDSKLELKVFTFPDGRVLESFIQAEPWNGGPNTFLALRDHFTKVPLAETEWSQKTIDET